MSVYLLEHEEVAFEGFGWCIIHDLRDKVTPIYASHAECTAVYDPKTLNERRNKLVYGEGCWRASIPPYCQNCDAPVPDEIQVLFVLYQGSDSPMAEKYKGK